MRKIQGTWLALAALIAIGAQDIAAQIGPGARRGPRLAGVEAIMSMREELELTEGQIAELNVLRREVVEERSAFAAEMAEMRSRLAAGEIERSELMAFVEEHRDARDGIAEERRARVEAVLNEAQLERLQEARARRGAYMRGRADAGFRSRRGERGPRAFGPRGWGRGDGVPRARRPFRRGPGG